MATIVSNILEYLRSTNFTDRLSHAAFLLGLAGIVFLVWGMLYPSGLNSFWNRQGFKVELILKDRERAIEVERVLGQLMRRTGAERGLVMKFHNTTMFADGSHRIYASAVYEAVGPGLDDRLYALQDVPLSLIAGIDDVLDGRCITNATDQNGRYARVAGVAGAKFIVKCPLRSSAGRVYGLAGISFYGELTATQLANATNELDREMARLAGLAID